MELTLSNEMKFFYKALFGLKPPEKLIQHYMQAHNVLIDSSDFDEVQVETIRLILKKNLDPVGIELWLRHKRKRHLLSAKLMLVSYLAESGGKVDCFSRSQTRSKINLILYLIGSIFTFVRGYYQKNKYGLL